MCEKSRICQASTGELESFRSNEGADVEEEDFLIISGMCSTLFLCRLIRRKLMDSLPVYSCRKRVAVVERKENLKKCRGGMGESYHPKMAAIEE